MSRWEAYLKHWQHVCYKRITGAKRSLQLKIILINHSFTYKLLLSCNHIPSRSPAFNSRCCGLLGTHVMKTEPDSILFIHGRHSHFLGANNHMGFGVAGKGWGCRAQGHPPGHGPPSTRVGSAFPHPRSGPGRGQRPQLCSPMRNGRSCQRALPLAPRSAPQSRSPVGLSATSGRE